MSWAATGHQVTIEMMNNAMGSSCLIELDRTKNGGAKFVPLCTYQDRHDIPLSLRFMSFDEWWEKDIISFESEADRPVALIDTRAPL